MPTYESFKNCGVEHCKNTANYECKCPQIHVGDDKGWHTPNVGVYANHPRFVCTDHLEENESNASKTESIHQGGETEGGRQQKPGTRR